MTRILIVDATAHVLENPYLPKAMHGEQVVVTLILIALLGALRHGAEVDPSPTRPTSRPRCT